MYITLGELLDFVSMLVVFAATIFYLLTIYFKIKRNNHPSSSKRAVIS